MENDKKKEVALFRYGVIAPAVTNTYTERSLTQFFIVSANNKYVLLNKEVVLSPGAIRDWYYTYLKEGFDGLYPKTRSDNNKSRIMSDDTIERIHELKDKYPHITGTLIYDKLVEDGYITYSNTSKSTVLRYIRDNNLRTRLSTGIDRRAFEMEHANDCWQSDTSYGAYLNIEGKKVLTYLIITIDDASRLISGAEFFFNDNALNMQKVLKSAIKRFGIPRRLFVDNGKSYKNEQLSLICASVGTVLIHAKIYSPESKGKNERVFRTIKHSWLNGIDWNEIESLEELNELLNEFINKYNNSFHSGINEIPNSRWHRDFSLIRKIETDKLDKSFLHTKKCKVRSDALALIKGISFETSSSYIGKEICIKYDPNDLSEVYIYEENKQVVTIKPVNKIDNSKIKRKQNIY